MRRKYLPQHVEFFHSQPIYDQPIFDEYSDDGLEIIDLDVSMVITSNKQIHKYIHFIIYEHPEPMYDSYASNRSMEEEDHFVDYHDDIVDVVVQGTCKKIQDNLDSFYFQCPKNLYALFLGEQMKYHLISETEEQCDPFYQLEMHHN